MDNTDEVKPIFRDINYVSKRIGVSPQTIRRWVRNGAFPAPCNHNKSLKECMSGNERFFWTEISLQTWFHKLLNESSNEEEKIYF